MLKEIRPLPGTCWSSLTRWLSLPASLLILAAGQIAQSQPVPKLNGLYPEWLQRGTSTELSLQAQDLDGFEMWMLNDATHIFPTNRPPANGSAGIEVGSGGITLNAGELPAGLRLFLSVSGDAPMGTKKIRAVTRNGVSNPLQFFVQDLPQILENGANTNFAGAQRVDLPAGINGKINVSGETDYYRFAARKGQRFIFEVIASQTGSPLDSSLGIHDATGKELARAEDYKNLDSLLDFAAPEDGDYVLSIRDFRYQGGAGHRYHINAGALPFLDSLFPFGAKRGQSAKVEVIGRNLESQTNLDLRIASDAPLGPQELRVKTPAGSSNPLMFVASDLENVFETEPNDSTNTATTITLPASVNGRIQSPKDRDYFKVKVTAGQRWIFEVQAAQFGSLLDAVLVLSKLDGTMLQQNDDAVGADARIDQTFGEAGEYLLQIRDLRNRGGLMFPYRINISMPEGPNFGVSIVGENPKLYRDARAYVRVEASRRGGFGGPVEVVPVDLPPGVEADPVAISPEQTSGLFELRARTNAPLGTFPFKVEARAYLADKMQTRRPRITIPGETASAYLTLLPEAPFQISLLTPTVIMEQKQGADLMAEVKRTAAATQKIQLTLDGWSNDRAQAVTGIEGGGLTINAGETRGTMKLKANLDSIAGDRQMYLRGETSIDGKNYTVYGPTFPMVVREFPFTLASSLPKIGVTVPANAMQSAAAEAEFTIKATRRGLFTDDISLAIEGLPEGITISSTNLSRGSSEVAYKLLTTPKAQGGKTNTLTIVGTANVNGRQFTHRDTKITLVISAPSVEVATNQTAKAKP